jgi:two-component system, cell cycle sensor histidine kinase and response regulator CckA
MPSNPSRPIRVLHLEDSPRDADIISHKLGDSVCCEIVVVNSEESFTSALAQESFDLVLCDYNLPGYDGLSALKRAKETRPDTPVIIISGSVGEEEAVRCLQTGATDYLLKQRLERLAPAVSRAIQEAEDRRSRARAEEALQERERRLSSIYESVADALFYMEVEPDGSYPIISVNPAFLATTGLDYTQVLGRCVDQVMSAPVLQYCAAAIRDRRIVRWEETSEFHRGRRVAEMSVAPVLNAAGECTHLVGAIHDVTERRQLEDQLRQAQKMESVGQLAGGIAHDFNNLLTIINGTAELVLEEISGRDQPQIENDLQEIRRAGERAAGLTGQLLAFSRKQILQPQIIDVSEVVADIGNMLRRLVGEDVDLVIRSAAANTSIKADRGQIEQVIANLVVNARDAMPQGGTLSIEIGTIDVDGQNGREDAAMIPPGRYVTLAVRDKGTGMDEPTRQQIFEPFFTTKGLGKGTGLGLSTVYGIVKQSAGFICVDSEVGRGSCFTIYLPLVADEAESHCGHESTRPARGAETILVVEDVVALRRLMTRTLESAGYTVLSAGGGEEALQLLESPGQELDLMITDVVMAGMSGRSLAEHLRQTRPDVKVLYMSGYTDDVILRHGILEHEVAFISKPFGTGDLIRKIRQILDGVPQSH